MNPYLVFLCNVLISRSRYDNSMQMIPSFTSLLSVQKLSKRCHMCANHTGNHQSLRKRRCSLTGSWRLLLLGETGCTKDLGCSQIAVAAPTLNESVRFVWKHRQLLSGNEITCCHVCLQSKSCTFTLKANLIHFQFVSHFKFYDCLVVI